jgi:hypothetical protein
VLEAYTTPPEVNEVSPVPPFVVASVPASVTAPVVAVLGVNPVEPALKDATVPAVVAKVPLVGSVTFVAPVVVSVRAFAPDVASVEPLASVNVPVVLLTVRPLREVAVAAPRTGVTSVGEVDITTLPVPVMALDTKFFEASVNTACEADNEATGPSEFTASTTFVPSQYRSLYWPAGTAIPVPPEVFSVRAKPPVVSFLNTYILLTAGQMTFLASPGVPVATMNIRRASSAVPELLLSVYATPGPPHVEIVVVPATAASSSSVMPVFTVWPHWPANSPVAGSVRRSEVVYEEGIFYLKQIEEAPSLP